MWFVAAEGRRSSVGSAFVRGGCAGAVAGAVLAAGLVGCSAGGRGSPAGPQRAVEAFEAALQRGDLSAACGLLAPPTRRELEADGEPCAEALDQQDVPPVAPAGDLEVFGDEAIAHLAGDVLFLTNVAGRWLVSAAGCAPRPDQPYDCEVKP